MLKSPLVIFLSIFLMIVVAQSGAQTTRALLQNGWQELVKDNDIEAYKIFTKALTTAREKGDTMGTAESWLYMGICTYGTSLQRGLEYATNALDIYERQLDTAPSRLGQARCLQLISSIYYRQNKLESSEELSRKALTFLDGQNDSTGTLGLIYVTLGNLHHKRQKTDSAACYFNLALEAQQAIHNTTYLPGALVKMGNVHAADPLKSLEYFSNSLKIADSTGNRQAVITASLALGRWQIRNGSKDSANRLFLSAYGLSDSVTDKSFGVASLKALVELNKQTSNTPVALKYMEMLVGKQQDQFDVEQQQIINRLEAEFQFDQKNKQLLFIQKENQWIQLKNKLLWGGLLLLTLSTGAVIVFQRRINRRDKQLIAADEEVKQALREQHRLEAEKQKLEATHLKNEIDHKESQLSALALQMFQKNEWIKEVNDQMESLSKDKDTEAALKKVINKGLNQTEEWESFDAKFESINKNFYIRMKQVFPDISPNDLKICALIKLNLSTKEMAGILNISPDSVKTARYRLRKKLQLNTEDNLTEFIMGIQ